MKLIVAVIRDPVSDRVLSELVEHKFGVTRIASSGGFLRRGSTTLWIGTEEARVDEALETIRTASHELSEPGEPPRAVAFVLDVARYEQL